MTTRETIPTEYASAETPLDTRATPAPRDTQEIALHVHDTVAELVPDDVRRTKRYRLVGQAWAKWR